MPCLLWLSINLAQPSHVCTARCARERQKPMWSLLVANVNGACCARDQVLTNPFFLSPGHAHGAGLYFSSPTPRSLCQRPVSTDAMQVEVIGILSARYGRAFLVQIQNYLSDLLPSAPSSPSPSLLPLCSLLLLLSSFSR